MVEAAGWGLVGGSALLLDVVAGIQASAAGAILTMLADTMIPRPSSTAAPSWA